ncbi:MAG TPA: ATP-dependent zinc metalloprotease FtsH, partial [Polyangia bacterium]
HKTFLVWVMLIFAFLVVWQIFSQRPQETPLAFSSFIQKVEKSPDEFKTGVPIEIRTNGDYAEFRGQLKTSAQGEVFRSTGLIDSQILDKLSKAGLQFQVARESEGGFWQQLLATWLPMVVLIVLFLVFMRQIQVGGGKAMSFGKSKAKLLSETQKRITFTDVAGIEEAKDEVEEIIAFLKDPKKFTRLGGRIPKGVLMMGPPGTGKTLLARAIAGEAGVPFFSISGSDFVEMFVGVGASRVRDLFDQGKKNAPCIIFIDEIDAVGRHRGAGLGGGHDEREQTLNQLLVEMDGFESNDGVILIAATNRPDVLDPALLRPGRFDRRIVVPRPDVKGRLGILKVHTKKTPLGQGVDLEIIARGTPGFSGADLENLVNEAALLAARADKDKLDAGDFEAAKDKVLMGPERRSMIISENDKRVTAYHEAGHALIGKMMKGSDPIHKVTIIPRGRALGLTQQLPVEDRLNLSKEGAHDQIAVAMGGRVAEELVFGQITTGASNDIQVATDLARKMVCDWGMSEKLGPLHFGRREEMPFLGRDISDHKDYSEQTAVEIDAEVRRIVTTNYERAHKIVVEHMDKLKLLAEALLEFESIEGNEIDQLFAGKMLQRPPSATAEKRRADAAAKAGKTERAPLFPRPLGDPEKA